MTTTARRGGARRNENDASSCANVAAPFGSIRSARWSGSWRRAGFSPMTRRCSRLLPLAMILAAPFTVGAYPRSSGNPVWRPTRLDRRRGAHHLPGGRPRVADHGELLYRLRTVSPSGWVPGLSTWSSPTPSGGLGRRRYHGSAWPRRLLTAAREKRTDTASHPRRAAGGQPPHPARARCGWARVCGPGPAGFGSRFELREGDGP